MTVEQLRPVIDRMTANLRVFASTVQHFTSLVEQDVSPVTPNVRWWRWNGEPRGQRSWELLRTRDGVWIGFPAGHVAHPPLYAQAYRNASGAIIESVDGFGGFVMPPELPFAETFEEALCSTAT